MPIDPNEAQQMGIEVLTTLLEKLTSIDDSLCKIAKAQQNVSTTLINIVTYAMQYAQQKQAEGANWGEIASKGVNALNNLFTAMNKGKKG